MAQWLIDNPMTVLFGGFFLAVTFAAAVDLLGRKIFKEDDDAGPAST